MEIDGHPWFQVLLDGPRPDLHSVPLLFRQVGSGDGQMISRIILPGPVWKRAQTIVGGVENEPMGWKGGCVPVAICPSARSKRNSAFLRAS